MIPEQADHQAGAWLLYFRRPLWQSGTLTQNYTRKTGILFIQGSIILLFLLLEKRKKEEKKKKEEGKSGEKGKEKEKERRKKRKRKVNKGGKGRRNIIWSQVGKSQNVRKVSG